MATAKQLYRNIVKEHGQPWCWACGRGPHDKPLDWFAPWFIERSHIVNKTRSEDRRAIVLLCGLCHRRAHGQQVVSRELVRWPRLERRHLLWLKSRFDPEFFDREFLQAHCIGRLPRAVKPPAQYLRDYLIRRGVSP